MKVKFKVRNVDIEIDFEMYDGELDEWKVVKVADSENDALKEYFYSLIEFCYKTELELCCFNAIELHNEQIKIERYLDVNPR